jgi:hypothetical protein
VALLLYLPVRRVRRHHLLRALRAARISWTGGTPSSSLMSGPPTRWPPFPTRFPAPSGSCRMSSLGDRAVCHTTRSSCFTAAAPSSRDGRGQPCT